MYLFDVNESFPICMYTTTYVPGILEGQKRALDPLKPE